MRPLRVMKENNTVTIYRVPANDTYQIAWYELGERRKATCTRLEDAKKRADQLLEHLTNGRPALTAMSLDDARELDACRKEIKPTGLSMYAVVREYMRTWKPGYEKARVSAAIAEYQHFHHERSAKFRDDLRWRLGAFEQDFGRRYIDEVSSKEVRDWCDARTFKGKPASNRTKANYLAMLRGLWNYAQSPEVRHIPEGKHALEGLRNWKHDRASYSYIFLDEIDDLIKACLAHKGRDQLMPFLCLQLFAGLRSAEAMRLEWDDLIIRNRKVVGININAKQSKTGTRRSIDTLPMFSSMMSEWAVEQHATHITGGLICRWKKLPHILRRTGKVEGKMTVWKHNCLRHTFATHLLRTWGDEGRVATYLGTSRSMINSHYKEQAPPEDSKKFMTLRRWWNSAKPPARLTDPL